MLDQMQETIIIETLPALSEHPDFQAGLRDAQAYFLENYEAPPLTEDEMIDEVEMELSRHVTEHCRRSNTDGDQLPSYFYSLGFVFGTINEGLTYACQVC